jgi:hypothetical protein
MNMLKTLGLLMMAAIAVSTSACDVAAEGEGEGEGTEGEGEGVLTDLEFCQTTCAVDADCPGSFVCDSETSTCVLPPQCATDGDCIAVLGGWTAQPCTEDGDCAAGPCMDLDGAGPGSDGGCAIEENPNVMCSAFMFAPIDWPTIGGETVSVCAPDDAVCVNESFCSRSGMAVPPPDPCVTDMDCSTFPVGSQTCLPSGACGCATDADCTGSDGNDVCSDGICGCDADSTCGTGKACTGFGVWDSDDTDG